MQLNSLNAAGNIKGGYDSTSGASWYAWKGDNDVTQARKTVLQDSQNFRDLSLAIHAQELGVAQKAYNTLQRQIQAAAQSAGVSSLFSHNSRIGTDFQAIGNALQTGDAAGAQAALYDFKQDMRAAKHQSTPPENATGAAATAATQPSSELSTSAGASGLVTAVDTGNGSADANSNPNMSRNPDGTGRWLDVSA